DLGGALAVASCDDHAVARSDDVFRQLEADAGGASDDEDGPLGHASSRGSGYRSRRITSAAAPQSKRASSSSARASSYPRGRAGAVGSTPPASSATSSASRRSLNPSAMMNPGGS